MKSQQNIKLIRYDIICGNIEIIIIYLNMFTNYPSYINLDDAKINTLLSKID